MRHRHPDEFIRRRLLAKSAVNAETPQIEGCHCRDVVKGIKDDRPGQDYGRMWDGQRLQYMHRLSHEVWLGPIPAGLDVMHRCDRPRCIEPLHIKAATAKENSEDMAAKGRARNGAEQRIGCPNVHIQGARHPRAKLDERRVREFKALLEREKELNISALARDWSVSPSLLYGIRDGRNWSWL